MASYWKYTSTGTNYWIYLIVENVDQDIANNRSKVRYKAYIEGASATSSWGTGSYTVSINGAQTSGSVQYDFSSSKTWYCVGSASAYVTSGYITHNSDGTKSINVSFSFSGASLVGSATINETFTLNTIPRASDVSVGNYSITNTSGSISATITSKANFYHKWRWKIGSGSFSSWTNKGLISTTSSTVTVANTSLLSGMPTSTSATFTIEVRTYSDSGYATLVGTKTATCTVSVNTSNIKPSVTLGNIALNTSPISGYAVAGYSTVKSSWSASGGYGTTSNTTYFTVSNGSLTSTSSTSASGTVTSNTIPQSASNYTLTISAYSKDSRGAVSDTVSKSITVYGYQPPTATLSAYRVADSTSTTEDGAGVYVYVTFSGAVRSSVNSQNSVQSTTCTYSGSISGTATNGQHIALADSQSATFTLTVTDKVTSSTAIVSVAPALYPLDLYDNGQGTVGVGFGTTAVPNRVTSAMHIFVGESFMSDSQVQAGSVTHNGNTYIGCHSLAGKIFLRSTPTQTDIKALSTMNHSGAYKDIISVDQNNNATFYGNAETSTYSTNTNNAQRLRSYNFDSVNENYYYKLGTLVQNGNSRTTEIIVYTGQGFNANVQQQGWARIQIKNAWQSSPSATNAFGITYQVFGFQMENFEVVGIATDYQTIQIWVKTPWQYGSGNYIVMGYYDDWQHDGTTNSSTIPSGTQQPRAKINSDESIVLWSGTLQGGNIISLAGVAQYCRALKIYAQSYAGSIVFEMDLTHASTNTSTAGNVYARTGVSIHIASVAPETHYCECEVVRNKTEFYCRNMGFIVGTTNNARNNNSSYFVYKIEGIL